MRKFIMLISLVFICGSSQLYFAYSFSDNFNDGDLTGWTEKKGAWSNHGDYLLSSFDNYGIIWKDDSLGLNQFLEVKAYFDDGANSKSAQLRLRSGDAGNGPNPYFDHGYFAQVQDGAFCIYNAVEPYHQELLGNGAINFEP